jgi:hypothetical protein
MSPNSGVVNAFLPPGAQMPGGVQQAQFAQAAPGGGMFALQRTQVFFTKPAGVKVHWFTQGQDGKPRYSTIPMETPFRYNFAQSAIYRLKLTHIPGRPGLELFPTLEVVPTGPKTNEFLAHNSVPVEFSEEDFKNVVDRNYIVKVIYLPDPQFQDAGGGGPDEIVSTRLDPGQDPIQEALRRGSILLVVRIGNIDQGLTHSPPITAPLPGGAPAQPQPGGHHPGVPPLMQVPFPLHQGHPPAPPAPLQLPKMPPANGPAKVNPKDAGKVEPAPAPKNNNANFGNLPGLKLPPPPALNADDAGKPDLIAPPLPAIPNEPAPNVEKPVIPPLPAPPPIGGDKSNVLPAPGPQVIPAVSGAEPPAVETPPRIDLPTLPPAVDPNPAARQDLPAIPIPPPMKQ